MRSKEEIAELYKKVQAQYIRDFGVILPPERIREVALEFLKERERQFVKKMITHIPDYDMHAFHEFCKNPIEPQKPVVAQDARPVRKK